MADKLHIEIVYIEPQRKILRKVEIESDATVGEAIRASGIEPALPAGALDPARIGIFGRLVTLETALRDGDRIELYRSLQADPKESRRRRARQPD